MSAIADVRGRPFPMRRAPRRIVSLVPSLTEALFAFGAGERVVGVTRYCVEPAAARALPHVGGTKDPDVAAILALRPGIVIASAEENRREDVEEIEAAGVAAFVTLPATVQEARAMLAGLAAVTGCINGAAPFLAELAAALTEAAAWRGAAPTRVFCPIWRRPYMSVGAGTYAHDLLAVCGGANVFGDRPGRYPTVTIDEIVAADPHAVLLPDEPYPFAAKHRDELMALPIAAARDGRIHLCDGKDLTWYGPRTAGALRRVRELLAPSHVVH